MEEPNKDLLNQFIRYHNLLLRYHHQRHRAHGGFVDPMRGQGRVLAILKMKPEITQRELAYLLDMRGQSLSELLSKLETKGYITRTPSQEDRRVMVVQLTGEGAAAVEETQAPDLEQPFQCLSEEEQKTLGGYMARLITAMEEELGAGEDPAGGFDPRHFDHRAFEGLGGHRGGGRDFDGRIPPQDHMRRGPGPHGRVRGRDWER